MERFAFLFPHQRSQELTNEIFLVAVRSGLTAVHSENIINNFTTTLTPSNSYLMCIVIKINGKSPHQTACSSIIRTAIDLLYGFQENTHKQPLKAKVNRVFPE